MTAAVLSNNRHAKHWNADRLPLPLRERAGGEGCVKHYEA